MFKYDIIEDGNQINISCKVKLELDRESSLSASGLTIDRINKELLYLTEANIKMLEKMIEIEKENLWKDVNTAIKKLNH